ncbi:MAG: ubiquinone biosynthesis protein UbiB [Gallionellaceae bacterium]|nr:MAG: ubiquinone biosynthesis protein UbiB [Gallionellaceae bacterium]
MLLETVSAMRDLPRLHEITTVMIRHGFGDVMQRLGVISLLERAGQMLHLAQAEEKHAALETPQRIRLAFEELGPTFVKLSQLLATRVDVFPPEWIAEFEKLQDSAPPVAFEKMLPTLETALGQSPFELFRDLQTEPCGSASIAQVHRAALFDGTQVVLKICRPGIRPKIEADLRILGYIAALIESEIPEARRYQPVQIVKEFGRSLLRELDLALEARTQERFRENFARDPGIVIPRIYWEWTRQQVNVQQYIAGIAGNDLSALDASGLDRKLLATRGADAVLKMILIDGHFHADPHPGNVFYLSGNRLALLDFGMVGRLSEQRRNQIVNLLIALAQHDEQGMLEVLLEWTEDSDVDEARLYRDVSELAADYEFRALKDIHLGELLGEVTAIMRAHSIILPSDLTLLFKALITLEGLGLKLDPDFHITDHIEPFLKRVVRQRYHPSTLLKRGRHGLHDILSLVSGLPRDAARLLKEARRGRLKIDLDIKRLDHFGHQIDHSTNRLTIGILTASLIIGSSIVMTVQGGPTLFGLPLFGLLGFMIAFFNSLWILLSIWRADKE